MIIYHKIVITIIVKPRTHILYLYEIVLFSIDIVNATVYNRCLQSLVFDPYFCLRYGNNSSSLSWNYNEGKTFFYWYQQRSWSIMCWFSTVNLIAVNCDQMPDQQLIDCTYFSTPEIAYHYWRTMISAFSSEKTKSPAQTCSINVL
jgi:hypothetical protein